MSETTNYRLYITDDSSERFQSVREKLYGETNSNMVKIDTALGGKADNSESLELVLRASEWTGVEAPFTQELSVTGLTASKNGYISISNTATAEQREIAREAMLGLAGQSAGKLIVVADGEMPEFDLPVTIIILG